MRYDFNEVFAIYKGEKRQTEMNDVLKVLNKFIRVDRPGFLSIINPFDERFFVYEKNFFFDFENRPHSLLSIAKSIVNNQAEIVKQIDKEIVTFLNGVGFPPFDIQIVMILQINGKSNTKRTIVRKITVLSNQDKTPEFVLVTISEITDLTSVDGIRFEIRHAKLPKDKEKIVKDFETKINTIINKQNLLSNREREVLEKVSEGKTSNEIAEMLCISKATVDTHRQNILRKTKKHCLEI